MTDSNEPKDVEENNTLVKNVEKDNGIVPGNENVTP